MNKVILTGDLHLRTYEDVYDEDGMPLKLKEIFSAVEQMVDYARSNEIKDIFVLGDINDTKSIASVKAFLFFSEILERSEDMNWYLLGGNHDLCGNVETSNFSAIELFNGRKNVKTFINPQIYDYNGIPILFLPYYNTDVQRDLINKSSGIADIVFGHLGLGDATLSSGISITSPFNSSDFSKFRLVFLGHYHKPQVLSSSGTEIVYVGSPIQLRRDEINEEKRFIVLDMDNLTYESIPTKGYRKYYEYIVEGDISEEAVKEEVEKLKKMNFIVTLKMKKKLSDNFIKELEDVRVIDMVEDDFNARGILSSMNLEEQMKKYLELSGIDPSAWDEYLTNGVSICKEKEQNNKDVK